MVAKRFFYVCAGLLCLALAYHLGAQSATAQAPSNPVVGITGGSGDMTAVTSNGDTYFTGSALSSGQTADWQYRGNMFSGPTPATQETWGGVKAKYRPGAGAATQDK